MTIKEVRRVFETEAITSLDIRVYNELLTDNDIDEFLQDNGTESELKSWISSIKANSKVDYSKLYK